MAKKNIYGEETILEAPVSSEKIDGEKLFNEVIKALANALLTFDPKTRADKIKALCAVLDEYGLNVADKIPNEEVEELRTALARLGLKIIDDINAKRVGKPEIMYDALVAIFNAIK